MGRQALLALAPNLVHVILLARSGKRAASFKQEVKQAHQAKVSVIPCDMSSMSSVHDAMLRIINQAESVDVLVNTPPSTCLNGRSPPMDSKRCSQRTSWPRLSSHRAFSKLSAAGAVHASSRSVVRLSGGLILMASTVSRVLRKWRRSSHPRQHRVYTPHICIARFARSNRLRRLRYGFFIRALCDRT